MIKPAAYRCAALRVTIAGMPKDGDNLVEVPLGALGLQVLPMRFLFHQRDKLVATTRLLEEHARTCPNESQRHFYAVATTVCAQAAVEAILNEWAEGHDASTYKAAVKIRNVVERAELLLAMINGHMPADLAALSTAKNALCHAEPDNMRSGKVGAWVTTDGAQRALAVVLDLQEQFFPPAT